MCFKLVGCKLLCSLPRPSLSLLARQRFPIEHRDRLYTCRRQQLVAPKHILTAPPPPQLPLAPYQSALTDMAVYIHPDTSQHSTEPDSRSKPPHNPQLSVSFAAPDRIPSHVIVWRATECNTDEYFNY